MFKSLKFKIFSFIFVFLATTIVAQALLSAYFFQKQTIIRENVKIENIAKFTSGFFAETYDKNYSTDFEKFSESARNLISISPVLDAVQMTDIKGKILFDTRFLSKKGGEQQDIFIEKELLGYVTSSKPVYLKGDEGVFTTAVLPVMEELGFHRYTLFYRINYSSLADEASAMVRQFAQITAIFFALFLALCLFFIFALLKPLSDLEGGIKIVNQGNFDYKLKTDGGDEITNIALGFNKMAQDLKHSMLRSQKVSALEQELLAKEKDLAARLADVKAKTEEIEQFKVALLNLSEDAGSSRDLAIKERDKTVAIINNFADALLVLGKNNEILLANPMAEKYFKIKKQEAVGKALGSVKDNAEFAPVVQFLEKSEQQFYRKELSLSENFILEVSAIIIRDDKTEPQRLVIFHDITREKMIDKTKSEFVSIAAHQLRTPLSAIKWIFGMMVEGDWGKLEPEQKEYLQKGYVSTERLIRVVNDLLNVSRIEEGRFVQKPETAQLEDLAETVFSQHQNIAENKGLKFEFKKPAQKTSPIVVDKEQIKMVIENLLENAMNYTKQGGLVQLSVYPDDSRKEVILCMQDSGIGIPKEQQARIFTKFFRSSNAIRMETSGSGLGLFVTKNIIQNHNGRIWFESEEGKGARFFVALPIAPHDIK